MSPEVSMVWLFYSSSGHQASSLSSTCWLFTGERVRERLLHQQSLHRKDYAVKRHNEAKKYHRRRRGYFFLKLFLILIFYPIVPALIYGGVLWVWGIRNITMEALENKQNLARQIRGDSSTSDWFCLSKLIYSQEYPVASRRGSS